MAGKEVRIHLQRIGAAPQPGSFYGTTLASECSQGACRTRPVIRGTPGHTARASARLAVIGQGQRAIPGATSIARDARRSRDGCAQSVASVSPSGM